MSDTWYRDPVNLPPYEDGSGKLWTFDGRCLNPDPPRDRIDTWEEFTAFVGQRMDEIMAEALLTVPEPEPLTMADLEEMIRRYPPFPGCPIEGHKGCSLWGCRWDPEYTRR